MGILLIAAQLIVAGIILGVTVYPIYRACALSFQLSHEAAHQRKETLSKLLLGWSVLSLGILPLIIAVIGNIVQGGSANLGTAYGVKLLPIHFALLPWAINWLIGIGPAIKDLASVAPGLSTQAKLAIVGLSIAATYVTAKMG